MSYYSPIHMDFAFCAQVTDLSCKLILLTIAKHTNAKTGIAFPGITRLKNQSGVSLTQTKHAIKKLIKLGVVEQLDNSHIPIEDRINKNQVCYRINLAWVGRSPTQSLTDRVAHRPSRSPTGSATDSVVLDDSSGSVADPKQYKENINKKMRARDYIYAIDEFVISEGFYHWAKNSENLEKQDVSRIFHSFVDWLKNHPDKEITDLEAFFRSFCRRSKDFGHVKKPRGEGKTFSEADHDKVFNAWEEVVKVLPHASTVTALQWSDPLISPVLEFLGGLRQMGMTPQKDLPFVQKRFFSTYNKLMKDQRTAQK